jgi:hypothetical protein
VIRGGFYYRSERLWARLLPNQRRALRAGESPNAPRPLAEARLRARRCLLAR